MYETLIGKTRSKLFIARGCPHPEHGPIIRVRESDTPEKHNRRAAAERIAAWGIGRGVDPRMPHYTADVLVPFLIGVLTREEIERADVVELATFIEGFGPQPQPLKVHNPEAAKRNTTPGSADALIISHLSKHHSYKDGGCLLMEPIGGNELARKAGVSKGAVSSFWKRRFRRGGQDGNIESYRRSCANDTLPMMLAQWQGDTPAADAVQLLIDHAREYDD